MRAIRGRGNKTTETRLCALLAAGHIGGWTLNSAHVPFRPDVVFLARRVALFVDGCFWHGCPRCGHVPKTNARYWSAKIAHNRRRDMRARRALNRAGYSVMRIWECALRDHSERCVRRVRGALAERITEKNIGHRCGVR
jgi:DNA mismatch endonuclease (patch repair protein)